MKAIRLLLVSESSAEASWAGVKEAPGGSRAAGGPVSGTRKHQWPRRGEGRAHKTDKKLF